MADKWEEKVVEPDVAIAPSDSNTRMKDDISNEKLVIY